jgi:hypothetical protein
MALTADVDGADADIDKDDDGDDGHVDNRWAAQSNLG